MKVNLETYFSLLLIIFFLRPPPLMKIHGWTIFPAKYHICLTDHLSDKNYLKLSCHGGGKDTGDLKLLPDGSYNYTVTTDFFDDVMVRCDADHGLAGEGGTASFLAFDNSSEFVNGKCGSRHCIWVFRDDGIWVFNVRRGELLFAYPWRNKAKN